MKRIYLAIPYSGMEESSYEQSTEVMGRLMMLKDKYGAPRYNVFSPITHCHPLTKLKGIELPGNWEYWEKIDREFINWAEEVFVLLPKEGKDKVQTSTGVLAEMAIAREQGKMVQFIQLDDNDNLIML